ncbi:10935_t:CDS:2 [Diversispora eburnea]|uniref:10935_t:CDS:1 n=1 Tax=Diversispora eburnea TaxID=1213867 RepID=A0A9N8VL60_9GLOM|nr:10935_t:CDS:2 [Diversispora eburnea]
MLTKDSPKLELVKDYISFYSSQSQITVIPISNESSSEDPDKCTDFMLKYLEALYTISSNSALTCMTQSPASSKNSAIIILLRNLEESSTRIQSKNTSQRSLQKCTCNNI